MFLPCPALLDVVHEAALLLLPALLAADCPALLDVTPGAGLATHLPADGGATLLPTLRLRETVGAGPGAGPHQAARPAGGEELRQGQAWAGQTGQ